MFRLFGAGAILITALPIVAFCQSLSPDGVLVELKRGASTMASAIQDSKSASASCGVDQGKLHCETKAPSLHQLFYEGPRCDSSYLEFGWRLDSDLSDGISFVERATTLARSRELIDCSSKRCLTVVPTISVGAPEPNIETLSVCEVQLVATHVGPPEKCIEIVKRGQNERLIKSIIGKGYIGCSMGLRDFDVVFWNLANDGELVRRTVGEVLAAKPFSLSIEREGDAMLGTRSFVPSHIFEGWREWIVVRVSLVPTKRGMGATIATTILVSKQNTTSRESWTPASEQQEAVYLNALKTAIEKRGAAIHIGIHQ